MRATDNKRRFGGWKLASIIVAVPVILIAILIALLPYIANWATIHMLEKQGYQASFGQFDLDLLEGRLVGKDVTINRPGAEELTLNNLVLMIDWQALTEQKLQLTSLVIDGLHIDAGKTDKQIKPKITHDETDKKSAGWLFGLRSLKLTNFRVCNVVIKPGCFSVREINWQGSMRFDSATVTKSVADLPLQMHGELSVSGLQVTGRKKKVLLSLAQLSLGSVQIDSLKDIRLEHLQLGRFAVPRSRSEEKVQEPTELVKFRSLALNKMKVSGLRRVQLDKASMIGLGLEMVRLADGEWEFVKQMQSFTSSAQQHSSASETNATGPASLPAFSINQLMINKSETVIIKDNTFKTPFTITLQQPALSLSDIDSHHTDRASMFRLETLVDKHGTLDMEGELYPFHEIPSFKVKSEVSGIDLRPVTSYLERYLGHRVKSGQLSGNLNLAADAGKLDGVADVELQQFSLDEVDKEQANALARQLGTPLTATLALLREKDKSIHLKIPISGDISDPQFSTNETVKQVVTRAINEAVKQYYTDYGLAMAGVGQYSLAIKGAGKLFGFLTKLRFEPVTFDAGQHEIVAAQKAYLDNMAKMLIGRPEVHLTLCGYASVADLWLEESWLASEPETRWALGSLDKQMVEKLMRLANQRAANVKDYLVKQWSIEARRLIVCEPQYDAARDKLPRVEITI